MPNKYVPDPSKFRTCLNTVPVPALMLEGIRVVKVANNGRTKPAYLTLAKDRFTIYITETKFKNGKVGKLDVRRPLLRKVTSIGSNDDEAEHEKMIDIGSLDRIQVGQNTLRFELARKRNSSISSPRKNHSTDFNDLDPAQCFSVIFSGERTLDLMVAEEEGTTQHGGGRVSRNEIVQALTSLIGNYANAKNNVGKDVLLLRYIWVDVDKDRSDSINAHEFSRILHRINFQMKKAESDKIYNSFARMIGMDRSDRRKGMSFENVVTILHKIKRDSSWHIKPVNNIWYELFGRRMNNGKDRTKVSAESFLKKFFWKKQGENEATMEQVGELFRSLNQLEVADVASNLHLDAQDSNVTRLIDRDRFEAYIFSQANDIFDPAVEQFHPGSMDQSISDYWINSSHNTYLMGDQVKSRSSVEMYINALYRGCRCLELDCFDGHRDSRGGGLIPLVYHAFTIVGKISFLDIIKTIKFFLDSNPECFPVILSLENHCSAPFQDAMASSMISIFGESLYIPNEDTLDEPLPSPNELRGKVLLKGRRITDTREDYYNGSTFDTDSEDDSDIEDEHTIAKDERPLSPKTHASVKSTASATFSLDLSRITLFHGVKLNTFKESASMTKDCMLSIDESKARKLSRVESQRFEWIKYNQTHLSRVYPSGKRVDSSNFNPMTAWSKGCQLVALNLQTPDAMRRLHDGRFRQNGDCGYVLKPPTLRSNGIPISPDPMTISIKVLCASCLPRGKGDKRGEIIDPYVHVSVYDVSPMTGRESIMGEYTHHVQKNGFNPIWVQEAPFRFKVENPDVAMLQFTVWDRDVGLVNDDFIASASIPFSCVREGYRSVHLFDANNKRNGAHECAALLVEVEIKRKTQKIAMW